MAKMAVLKNFHLNNHIKNIKNFLRIINVRIFTIFSESKISISILRTENRNKTIFLKISTQIKHFYLVPSSNSQTKNGVLGPGTADLISTSIGNSLKSISIGYPFLSVRP